MTKPTITVRRAPSPGEDWYEKILDKRMRELPADSTIIAIGSYGYDWVQGRPRPTRWDFDDAMVAARDAGATVAVR